MVGSIVLAMPAWTLLPAILIGTTTGLYVFRWSDRPPRGALADGLTGVMLGTLMLGSVVVGIAAVLHVIA